VPNIIKLTVENADELLNAGAYGAASLIRLQWSATATGSFADVSGTGSTPTTLLVSGTRAYTGYDPAGTSSLWYRTRYENAGATRLSDWSDPFQVGGEAGGQLCSIYDAKQRLTSTSGGTIQQDDEELLDEMITQVSSYIQGYTGRQFARIPSSGEQTYLFDIAEPTSVLRIPPGIASMSVLEVATISQPETGGTFSTIPTTEWMLRPVVAERDFGWPATSVIIDWRRASVLPYFYWGRNVVRATMALGFGAVPKDIEAIALSLVVASFRERASSGGDSYTVGIDGSRTFENALSYRDRMTLDRYRVRSVG
jgi:hypothetical protein